MSQDRARSVVRRRLTAVVAGLALAAGTGLSTAAPAAADQDYWVPADGRFVLDGHGYGHGRGMSQYGARGAALSGVGWRQILDFYYPGTTLGTARGQIRVLLTAHRSSTLRVSPARRLRVRDLADGTSWLLEPPTSSTSRWELRENAKGRWAVKYLDSTGWNHWRVPGRGALRGEGAFLAGAPLTLWQGSASRQYRGRLQTARTGGGLRVVNGLSLESYIRGVVPAEMPSGWEADALAAQSVAARTFAVRHRAANPRRWFHVDDTIMYQVYGGVGSEASSTNRAIAATARTIVKYGGSPALTEFSSSSGGWTAGSGIAYQVVKPDPYDAPSGNPNANWTTTLTAGALESRYPALGKLQRITVTRRNGAGDWGGRIEEARLVGSSGTVMISGNDLRMQNGLRSTWFAPRDTPIITHWRSLGGAGSLLGTPTRAESATSGGTYQPFEIGRIYHHPRVGAAATYGRIAGKYYRLGATSSIHGFPRRDVRQGVAGNGKAALQAFQVGRIYYHPATGAHGIHGPIAGRYYRLGGPSSALGFPRTGVRTVTGGLRSDFQGGYIRWNASTGKTRVVVY